MSGLWDSVIEIVKNLRESMRLRNRDCEDIASNGSSFGAEEWVYVQALVQCWVVIFRDQNSKRKT